MNLPKAPAVSFDAFFPTISTGALTLVTGERPKAADVADDLLI
jgi:hypothetical protein